MTFEEDFPSLNKKVPMKHTKYESKCYCESSIQECCLDKQRVKEQLDYWIGSLDDDWVVKNIKKELGL